MGKLTDTEDGINETGWGLAMARTARREAAVSRCATDTRNERAARRLREHTATCAVCNSFGPACCAAAKAVR